MISDTLIIGCFSLIYGLTKAVLNYRLEKRKLDIIEKQVERQSQNIEQ